MILDLALIYQYLAGYCYVTLVSSVDAMFREQGVKHNSLKNIEIISLSHKLENSHLRNYLITKTYVHRTIELTITVKNTNFTRML